MNTELKKFKAQQTWIVYHLRNKVLNGSKTCIVYLWLQDLKDDYLL